MKVGSVQRGSRRKWQHWMCAFLGGALAGSVLVAGPAPAAPVQRLKPQMEKLDNHGHDVGGKGWHPVGMPHVDVPAPVWPTPGKSRVNLSARVAVGEPGVRAKGLPVWVAQATGLGRPVSAVDVEVLDRKSLLSAWADALLLRLDADETTISAGRPGAVKLAVDYSGFRYASGGDWASRLRLWRVPSCALTTPSADSCRIAPLSTTNDTVKGIATAEVDLADGGFVTLMAEGSGEDGDFTATDLAPSSTWSHGGSSGGFGWNYPLRMPPSPAGPAPSVSLAYSSQSVDGRSETTNNQPSWLGEGFEYSPGYIERRYVPCSDDMKDGAVNTTKTGDLCWRSDNATMSLNGRGGELIKASGSLWRSRSESGDKIEKLTGGNNPDDNGEYWKVTGQDGTQYFFGLNRLPGETSATNSVNTVRVYGNHAGEPCDNTNFANAHCKQAQRWMLDYVVDVHGNTMSYWYGQETNKYAARNTDTETVSYVRASYLARIDYGTYYRTLAEHGVDEVSVTPTAQVVFDVADRCLDGALCYDNGAPVKSKWRDTPWDQQCKSDATTCAGKYSPTFWTTKRLAKVTARVWDTTKATPAWQDVESWSFTHAFPPPGDGSKPGLWLDRIDHAGHVGGTVSMPPVTFASVGMANRVVDDYSTAVNWLRISDIYTETGARIHVDYSLKECTKANTASLDPHTNGMRCYPVLTPDYSADPSGDTLKTEWWHKYVVTKITESDVPLANGHEQPAKHTFYEYVGAPAWHYADDDGLSQPKYKTWNQWRGYATVKTRVGQFSETQTLTVATYLRGMHKDRQSPAGGSKTVTVAASLGSETVYDEDQFAGMLREQVTYNGVESKPVSKTVNVPWRSNALATRTINGDTVEARWVNTKTTYSATALGVDGARGWRVTSGTKDFDHTYGTVTWSQNNGEVEAGGQQIPGDEKCVSYAYNRDTAKNLVTTVKSMLTTTLVCGTAPTTKEHVISDVRYFYDGATSVDTSPKYGLVTRTDQLADWVAGSGTVWQTVSKATFDSSGRTKTSTDIRDNTTTTTYTPLVGGPVTKVVTTSPQGWKTTVDKNPYWGSTVKVTDINGKFTGETEHDPLGRVVKVWDAGWTKTTHPDKPKSQFAYVFAPNRDAYPYVETKTLNAKQNYVTSYSILDGLLRQRQTQSIGLGSEGGRLVTDTLYDDRGLAVAAYGKHLEPTAPSGQLWWEPEWSVPTVNKTEYDRVGRATAAVFLSGDNVTNLDEKWRTVTFYEGDLNQVVPPSGGVPTTTVSDVEGRTVALRQHYTSAGIGGAYHETKYVYNIKDQLDKVVDPDGNHWGYEYDMQGRQTAAHDPDKGITRSTYNIYGELESTEDANGHVLWHVYDSYGRQIQLRDDTATGPLRAKWIYDLIGGFTPVKGQLTESVRYEPAGSSNAYIWRVTSFNARYQPNGVNYVVPAVESGLNGTYGFAYNYALSTGEVTEITYPGGGGLVAEKIITDYDDITGAPVRIDTNLVNQSGTMATAWYTAYGELSQLTRKMPGAVTSYVDQNIIYDTFNRRVKNVKVQPETAAGTVVDRSYDYDHAGNILSISDTPQVGQADVQCFSYNELRRLVQAWTPGSVEDCKQQVPTVAGLAGPAPYWTEWEMNATNSRVSETSHAGAGDTVRSYTFPQGGQGVVRPHAVTAMAVDAPGTSGDVTVNYKFDNAGNTVCRPVSNSVANNCNTGEGSQAITWTPEGKVAKITGSSGEVLEDNVYDAGGLRLIRRDATGVTLYLPGQEIRREGTVNTGTRYYSLAGQVCGSRTGGSANDKMTWTFSDHQGTQLVAVNSATQQVTRRFQDPYGAVRGLNPVWANQKGFVGGDIDPTGLTHIGARQYDPVLGRFISVDPKLVADDPAQYNAYQYGANNPITFSDPTGEQAKIDDEWYGTASSTCNVACQEQHKRNLEMLKQKETERKRQEAERKQRECQADWWCRTKNNVVAGAKAIGDWAVQHADLVGTVVGVGSGLLCTALTGGAGALLCGALAGAITGLVTGQLKCAGGDQSHCGIGNALIDVGIGAGLGALGGAGGAVLGGALKGAATGLRAGNGLLAGGISGAGKTTNGLIPGTGEAVRQLAPGRISAFISGSASNFAYDVGAMGGGSTGGARVALDTARLALRGMVSADGAGAGLFGGLTPLTREGALDFVRNGPSFDPLMTPISILGGAFGGALS